MSIEIYASTVLVVVGTYLLLGLVLFVPICVLAARRICAPRSPWWHHLIPFHRSLVVPCVLQVVLWPLAIWEVCR